MPLAQVFIYFQAPGIFLKKFIVIMRAKHNKDDQTQKGLLKQIKLNYVAKTISPDILTFLF